MHIFSGQFVRGRGAVGLVAGRWIPAWPSETENTYKIYAEGFRGADHLGCLLEEAQTIVSDALTATPVPERGKSRASSVLDPQTVSEAKDEWRSEGNPN